MTSFSNLLVIITFEVYNNFLYVTGFYFLFFLNLRKSCTVRNWVRTLNIWVATVLEHFCSYASAPCHIWQVLLDQYGKTNQNCNSGNPILVSYDILSLQLQL